MKRDYLIHMKNCTLSTGEIDAWSNYTHDYDIKITGGCIEFKGTEQQLDTLLDKLYSDESNGKCTGVQCLDEELSGLREKPLTFYDAREDVKNCLQCNRKIDWVNDDTGQISVGKNYWTNDKGEMVYTGDKYKYTCSKECKENYKKV